MDAAHSLVAETLRARRLRYSLFILDALVAAAILAVMAFFGYMSATAEVDRFKAVGLLLFSAPILLPLCALFIAAGVGQWVRASWRWPLQVAALVPAGILFGYLAVVVIFQL